MSKSKSVGLSLWSALLLLAILLVYRTAANLSALDIPMAQIADDTTLLQMGDDAPLFELSTPDGVSLSLADQRGKIVLVDFWATWCPPCRQEMPHLERIYQRYAAKGLTVLAVSLDSQPQKVAPFIAKEGYTFPVLLGDNTIQSLYGAQALPTLYLLDRQGKIKARHVGFAPGQEIQLQEEIEALLTEKVPAK